MCKAKCFGMQCLAGKSKNLFSSRNIRGEFASATICLIADQGVPDVAHMHPDLVRSSGFEPTFNFCRRPAEPVQDGDAGHGVAPALEPHCLPLSIGLVARELCGDFHNTAAFEAHSAHTFQSRIAHIRDTITKRSVGSLRCVRRELRGKTMVSTIRFGDNQNTGCILVDPMNDPRTLLTTDTGQRTPEMVQKCVYQSAGGRSRGGVHHHPGRLVDHDQVVILEQDGQGDVLGPGFHVHGLLDNDLETIALCHSRARV